MNIALKSVNWFLLVEIGVKSILRLCAFLATRGRLKLMIGCWLPRLGGRMELSMMAEVSFTALNSHLLLIGF